MFFNLSLSLSLYIYIYICRIISHGHPWWQKQWKTMWNTIKNQRIFTVFALSFIVLFCCFFTVLSPRITSAIKWDTAGIYLCYKWNVCRRKNTHYYGEPIYTSRTFWNALFFVTTFVNKNQIQCCIALVNRTTIAHFLYLFRHIVLQTATICTHTHIHILS